MRKLRLLDLFCGGGGAGRGYHAAGFEVVGVDFLDMSAEYPYEFHRADALSFLRAHWHEFDAVHASPPCKRHSSVIKPDKKDNHIDLVEPTRNILIDLKIPWVIENVVGAPVRQDLLLCGSMFGLRSYRHRIFEASFPLRQPADPEHVHPVWYPYDKRKGTYGLPDDGLMAIPVHGDNNAAPLQQFQAMGINPAWMSRKRMIQAIPPAFSWFVGWQMMQFVK